MRIVNAYRQIEFNHDDVVHYIKSVIQRQYELAFQNAEEEEKDDFTLDADFYTSTGDEVRYNMNGTVLIGEDSYECDWEDLSLDDITQIISSESFQQWANITPENSATST